MADPLVVNLLGPPRFTQAEVEIACKSRKSLGLFAYLMLSTRSHARRELAALLWGRRDEETARASLRVALHRMPAAMAECLRVDRDSIAVAAPPLVDVERFERLAKADDLDSLEQATELYQGELLQDFEADATPEFDDWLHAQRTRLAQVAQQAFDGTIARRAERARHDAGRATGERESALATGRRWAALMPGAEAAHRWLMQLYLDMGRRDAALAQYELCQRFLAVTYGRAPAQATRELRDIALGRSQAAETATPAETVEAARTEPVARSLVPATSFVGRVEELAELDRLLAEPECRLLTLHGLGGAGKTRLAHALATQVGARFAQGVAWVALEAVDSADALPIAIATALGRELPARGDHAVLVADMLANQQRLLVLDNMETVLARDAGADPVAIITRILERAPQVRIVATSREVLGLQEEWIYDVHGLPHTAQPLPATTAPAIELFAQRARQAYLGFSLSAEMPHVVRICSLVEGLPLGIELAAAWVRTIPCGEIAAAIEREATSLASAHRNRTERHRTLDAVVGYSWNLLRTEEQRALAALSAFAGGFTREPAERVAEASMRTLSALADKSLVRRRADGRYDLHELVRQFAWAKLKKARTRETAVTRRHADEYAAFLLETFADVRGPNEAAAHARLRSELANILAAWNRSLEADARDVVERMASTLVALLHAHARLPVALKAGEQAIAMLGSNVRTDVECSIRMQWGRAAITGGQPEVGRRELEAALALARRLGNPGRLGRCLYYLGALHYEQGDVDGTEAIAAELVPLAQRSEDLELVVLAHNLAGTIANMRSRFDVAEAHLRQSVAAARELGAPSLIGGMLCSLNVPVYYRGAFAEAAALLEEAAHIFEKIGRNALATNVRSNLAAVLLAQGKVDDAREHIEIALRMARDSGDRVMQCATLGTLADILIEQGQIGEARAAAAESLELASAHGSPLHVTESLYLLATAELRDGHAERVLPLLVRLRAELVENRLEVRVPMLVLAAADWIAVGGDQAAWARARRWLAALTQLADIDATLRDKAARLLERETKTRGGGDPVSLTLAEIEADVSAFLGPA